MATLTLNPDTLRVAAKIALYRQDFQRFAAEQLWIKPKVTAAEPVGTPVRRFALNPPQRVINAIAEKQLKARGYIRLAALKARQPGISTWTEARVFHSASLHPNVASLVLAQDDKTSAHIFGLAKLFYDHLDGDIKPMYRYCFDDETEVLTRRGWTHRADLSVGDDVYGLNPLTGTGCWTKVRSVYVDEQYRGPMVQWDSQDINALVTPEHRWLVTTLARRDRPPGLDRRGPGGAHTDSSGKRLSDRLRYSFIKTTELSKLDLIPKAAPLQAEDCGVSDDWLELLGWVASEGCYPADRHVVYIDQSHEQHPDHVERIAGLLRRLGALGATYHCAPSMTRLSIRSEVGHVIRQEMPDKRPSWALIGQLSSRQAKHLLDVLMLGDGAATGKGYWTADAVLADRVHAIAAIAGISSRIIPIKPDVRRPVRRRAIAKYGAMNWVALHMRDHAWGFAILKKQSVLDYEGAIWCPETDCGVVLARRRGRSYFTGQSTKTELTFENPDEKTRARWPGLRSKMHFQTAKNVHAGTGQTLTSLHWSEAAKVPDAQTIATSVFQSIQMAAGTLIVVESTAYPTGDWFRDLCERAKSGKDVWQFVFLPWFLSPEYAVPLDPGERLKYDLNERHLIKRVKTEWNVDLTPEQMKFRRWKIQEGGGDSIAEELFKQEYPSDDEEAWISTDLAVFDHRKLYEIRDRLEGPEWMGDIDSGPRLMTNPNGQLWIWKHPEKGHLYDIGADVATGTEDGDYSVAEVIDRSTREQVAEWRGHISTLDYATVLYWLGKYFNTAQIAVEVTGVGVSTNEKLNQMGYPYVYIWRYRGKAVPQLSTFSGWETGHKSKKVMIGLMRHLFLGDKFLIHSTVLHNEMKSFAVISLESGDETYRGSMGAHDDCVMAMAIALQISDDESWGVMQELRGDGDRQPRVRIEDPQWIQSIDPAFNEHLDARPSGGSGLDQMVRALRGWK